MEDAEHYQTGGKAIVNRIGWESQGFGEEHRRSTSHHGWHNSLGFEMAWQKQGKTQREK